MTARRPSEDPPADDGGPAYTQAYVGHPALHLTREQLAERSCYVADLIRRLKRHPGKPGRPRKGARDVATA